MTRSGALGRCVLLLLAIGLLSIGVVVPIAGAAGTAGSSAGLQEDGATTDDPDVTIDVDGLDGDSVWAGQTLAFEGFEPEEPVRFTHASGIRQRTADADGRLVADTSRWTAGSWSVTANGSDVDGDFELREQTLDASVEPTAASETATLVLDSSRVDYDVAVDATAVTSADLAAVFDDGWTSAGQFYLTAEENGGEYSFDAAALQAGDYQLELSVTDAAADATASVNVTSELRIGEHEPRPHENSSVLLDVTGDGNVGQGDVATFFRRQHRSEWKRPALFDFSDNGVVTHGDVVVLADYVATGQLPAEPDAEFVGGPFSGHEGDVAEIPVAVEGTDEAWVTVSVAGYDYTATVHLADVGNETTIEANTFRMGHEEANGTFAGEDVAGFTETGTLSQLAAYQRFNEQFDFRTRTYTSDPREGAEPTDVSQLSLDDRSTGNLTTYVAPADALGDGVETPEDLLADATRSSSVAEGDVLVAEVEASGLYGYLQSDAARYNDTADGLGDLAFSVSTVEDTPFGAVERTEDLSDLSAAELLVDEDDDRFLVAVPTDKLAFTEAGAPVGAGDDVEVGFEVGDGNPYVAEGEDETVSRNVTLESAVEFADARYAEHEGDVAEIPVTVGGLANRTDGAWVELALEEYDYTATVRLEDVDGETTVEANTFHMGHDGANDTFSGEDVAGFVERGNYADLAPGERFEDGLSFDLRTYASDPADGATVHDEAELTLEDRSTGNLTTYVAPEDALDGDVDVDSLTAAVTEGNTASVSEDSSTGDVIVAEVQASGVYGYLQGDASSYDATADGAGDLSIELTTEEETAFGTGVITQDLADLEHARLFLDEDEDRFFVAVWADDVAFDNYGGTFGAGASFDLSFEVGNESPYVDDGEAERVTGSYSLVERTLEIVGDYDENDRLRVPTSEDAELTAETTVAPGTVGSYFVETQDYIYHDDLTVSENGTATVTFDFSDGEPGDILPAIEFQVWGAEASVEGEFAHEEPAATFAASGSLESPVITGENATLEATVENQGDAAGEATISVDAHFREVIPPETVELEPAGSWTETVELEPAESWTGTYQIPTNESGRIHWDVGTQHDGTGGNLFVEEPAS